jgi:hypothetical protein
MSETVVLDPAAVATSRTALDITNYISVDGVDWGDAAIEAYLAKGHVGSTPVDFDIPNRTVTIPLVLKAVGATTFETIRAQVQAKVGLFHREGGWISRQTSIGTMYADVVSATLKMGGDWLQAFKSVDVNAVLSLELRPDWYGAEVTLDDKVETTALALTTVLKQSASDAVITGNYPGRVRIVADEDQGQTQLGLVWGFRSRYYDAASTAALTYQAEALTPLDAAGTVALTGASGGTVMQHSTLRTDWTGVLSTTMLAGTADLTHQGTYRCWARCYSISSTPPDVRLVWRLGDFVNPTENTRAAIPSTSNFHWLDLGEIRLDAVPTGTHKWKGQVHAIGGTANSHVAVDAVHFVPVDDGYGVLRAPQTAPTITSYSGLDSFTVTTAGTALNGRTAPSGGAWVTSGDATDFAFTDTVNSITGEAAKRSTTGGTNGRFAILGTTNYAAVSVECSVNVDNGVAPGPFPELGVIAHLRAVIYRDSGAVGGARTYLEIQEMLAGTKTVIAQTSSTSVLAQEFFNSLFKIQLTVTAAGFATATWSALGVNVGLGGGATANGTVLLTTGVSRSSLVTGGTLATGKPGFYDLYAGATAGLDRYYDDFRVAIFPDLDATMYPNQSVELRTEGIFRENSAGNTYAHAPHVGDLPRIPPSGLESRKVELYVKGSRGDFDQIADTGIDDISAQVFYRPTWLLIPGS